MQFLPLPERRGLLKRCGLPAMRASFEKSHAVLRPAHGKRRRHWQETVKESQTPGFTVANFANIARCSGVATHAGSAFAVDSPGMLSQETWQCLPITVYRFPRTNLN
jgi:hypothetical protein